MTSKTHVPQLDLSTNAPQAVAPETQPASPGPSVPSAPGAEGAPAQAPDSKLTGAPSRITGRGTDRIGSLERARAIDRSTFPNQPNGSGQPVPTTIANVRHLLKAYGIVPRYNVIKKGLVCPLPGYSGTPDNAANVALNVILSLATLNRLRTGLFQVSLRPSPTAISGIQSRTGSRAGRGTERTACPRSTPR